MALDRPTCGGAGCDPAANTGGAYPPRVAIGELDISNGSLSFADERVGYKNRFEELSFKLSALSTFSENKGPYALTATTPGGATLKWQGEASVTPLAANGTLALEHSALAELQPLLKNSLPGTLSSGRASVELPYEFALAAGKPQLTVRNGKLSIESQVHRPKCSRWRRHHLLQDIRYVSVFQRITFTRFGE